MANVDPKIVERSTQEILKRIGEVYSEYKGSFSYEYGPQGTIKEAAHHGFVAGVFMNFHYRYNLRVYLEQFAGRGYGDIILLARGKERSLNSVPIIIELKAGTGTPSDGLEQAKSYAKGFQPNTMRVLTTSDNVLCVGLNLDFTQNEKLLTHLSPPRDRVPTLPTIQKVIEAFSDWDGRENTIVDTKEKIKQPLERIYHTFPGTAEKGGNYFSRFLLGQLIHADEFRRVNLEKSIFLYDEYPLNLERRSGTKESDERPVTTFVLNRKGRSGEELFIFHVREGGRGERSDKKIPIDLPKVNKITEVYINVQEGTAPFNVEEIKRYNSVDQYKEGKKVFKGKLERVPYPNELKETFDRVLDSQRLPRPGQPTTPIQPTTINSQYQGLLEKIAEGIHPLRGFVKDESDFQGMLHGAFSYYSDLKLQEAPETRALVLTEFQTGRGKRTDMLIHGIKFQDWGADAKEYVPIGLELKGPRDGVSIDALKQEGNNQVKSEYEKGVTYKTLTDGDEVGFIVIVFNKDARNADSLISISNDNLFKAKVCHSSVLIPNQNLQSLDLAVCLRQGNRKKRSTSMSCIDSRDEEKITKEEKEELIKELFDTDEMRREAKSIEFYDELFRISEGVCKGKIFDLKDFVMKIRNIDPGSIDSEVRGVVKEIKKKISEEEIKNFLRKPEVSGKINKVAGDASVTYGKFSSNGKSESQNIIRKINSNTEVMNHLNRIGKISGWAMHGVMYKNLIGDIISGNAEGVAINLGFIAGNNVLGKLANAVAMRGERLVSDGKVFLGKSLKAASPFLARAATGFIIYDLVNQVKAYKAGDKDAMVRIVDDSIVITVDAVEIGIEVAEIAEILIGVSSVTGPIGAAVGVVVFIGTDVYLSVKTVERENEIIRLTGWEKFQEGWNAFLNIPPEKYIEKLIEEKLANNHLVDNAVDFLKQHTSINRYVFPTGRLVDRQRIKMDLDSVVLLDKKKKDIKWSRARPGNPKEGDFFCLPKGDYESVGGESYLCENAIGLSYSANRTGNYTLVDLGDGNDNVVGLKDIPHVFQVGDGRKTLTGGSKGDTFILYGNPINHTVLAGGDGDDTLDLTRLAWDVVELKNSSYDHYAELSNSGDSSSLLLLSSMETILGREKKQDIILCDRSFKYVDGKGGKNNQHLDKVTISHVPESGKLKVAVRPDTEIINFSGRGVFDYVAFCNKGKAKVRLCSKGDQLQHNVLFNYTLSDFSNIETQQSSLNSSTGIKNVSFNFQQGFSDTFNISIESITTNVSYVLLGDSTRIRVGNGGNLYALQSTDRPISNIIRDYPTIANRLNLTIVTEFQDEFIVIGHGKHEVMNNEPLRDSHLIGDGGENVYVITPTQKKVNVYDVHEGVAINTLDLRNVIKNVYGTSAKVSQDVNDLLIELEGMESLLKFPVRIKNGVQWHQKLHVVLDSMPMRIKHSGSNWNLSLAPLAFDNSTKIAVITAKDVDEGSELTVHKQAGNYTFSRLRNDLLIITDLSSKEGNTCTVLFSNFYEEPKMETLSIKFDNKTISLQEEMERINSSELIFCPTLLQINKSLSINSNKLLDGYDCLRFGSDDIAFIKSGNNLLLLSNQGVLSILDYYSKAHEKWSLSVELNNSIIKPEEFRERADNPSSLRYYLPSGNGLQIYHNQPTNKYQIGLVDLRNESISDYNMEANNSSLVLRSRNNVIEVENWNIDPSARKMMFVFNDTTVANVKCIISSCSPENITGEFRKVASINKRDEGGYAKIHRAVLLKDLAEVQSLLNIGAKIDAKDKFGKTSLHLAIEQDDFNMVKLLLNNNADVNAKDDYGNTPLQCIISRYFIPVSIGLKDEKFNMIKLLLDSDADIRAKDGNGRTPLHNIIIVSITNLSANDNEVSNLAQLFIDKDATILDEQDSRGDTPFRLAVLYRPNLQRYFIGKGAKANIQNNNGEAPYQRYKRFAKQLSSSTINSIEFVDRNAALRLAIKADDLNVVKSLVKKIANVDVENNNGQTILDFAIKNGKLDVVQYLVGEGVDNDGKTPFEIAFKYNKTEIIRFFATVRDKYGYTALHYSAEEDNLYLSNLLLDNNADINAKNNDGWTPVQLGAKNNKLEMVKSLTNRGASINTKNNYGWTVLHYAYAFGTPDMVNFLIDNGADIDAKTNRGEMPLEIAREYGNLRVEDFFQRNKEIAPERRRHHIRHERYYRGHRSRRLLVEEVESSPAKLFYFESTGTSDQHIITNETENSSQNDRIGYNKEKTTSGVSKPSSWVNTFVNTISDAVKGVYQLISSSPAIDMGRPQPSKAMIDQVTDVNGTLLLLDVFVRKITGKKYVSTADKPISPLEAQGYALNITKGFEKVVEQAGLKSGVSMHRLNIDYTGMQKEITKKVMRGQFNEISGVLSSYLEKACPSREAGCPGKLSSKKFDKFMVEFNSGLNVVLNQPIHQILHNGDGRLEVDGAKKQQMNLEPQSYLSNASVQGHSKDKVSTCLSDIGVTKLVNNLSR